MKKYRNIIGIAVALAAVLFGYTTVQDNQTDKTPASRTMPASQYSDTESASDLNFADAADRILNAFQSHESDLWIEAGGRVQQVLSDDSEGSRHQRFIVRLPNEHTVLIAHNIDLAQRVPLSRGDQVSFYGEYEWNDRGGVIHWTHHDPRDKRKGGWIEHEGTIYR